MCLQKPHYDPYEHMIYRMKIVNKWTKQIMEPFFEFSEHFSNDYYIQACDKLKDYNDISTTCLRDSKEGKNHELYLRENCAKYKEVSFGDLCDTLTYEPIHYIEKLMTDIKLLKEFEEVKRKLQIYEDVYDIDFIQENYLKGFVKIWQKKELRKEVDESTWDDDRYCYSDPVKQSTEEKIYFWDIPGMGKYFVDYNYNALMKIDKNDEASDDETDIITLSYPLYTSYNNSLFLKDYSKKGWVELTPMNQKLSFDNELNITDKEQVTILCQKDEKI